MAIQHKNLEIVVACREPSNLLANYSGEVRQGDLRDEQYLDRLLVGVDIICHAAGWSSFGASKISATQAYLEPTLDLIQRALEWRVSRFINLSSLYCASKHHRNHAHSKGQPRAYWPMINCHIAVEDYLRDYQQTSCQFINLRLGLYSGKRLNMGLLALLLNRSHHIGLPYFKGPLGHFPLVDGKDIGQAFARAALAPFDTRYRCLNITGPDTPNHREVIQFIEQQTGSKLLYPELPLFLADPALWIQGKIHRLGDQPLFTPAMQDMMKSPAIDNLQASQEIGYDPEISWQASLLNTLITHKNQSLNSLITQPVSSLNI